MSKKITIIAKYASSNREGFETRTFTLAREFVRLGHQVSLFTSDSNHLASSFPKFEKTLNYESVDGINVFWIKTLKYKKTNSIKRVLSWFDFELKFYFLGRNLIDAPDVIICTSLSPISIVNGIFLKKKYKKPKLIFEIRDIWPLTLIEEGGFSPYHPFSIFLGIIEKIGYKASDIVVGTMPNLKQHVLEVTKKNSTVHCIPFGVTPLDYKLDLNLYRKDNKLIEIKKKLDNKFTIGYAGSIGLSNGLNCIIELIKEFNIRDINFVFLGDGGLRKDYENQLKEYKNVFFLGKVKREKVKYYLNLFDVLYFSALPSKVWDYGWSLNKMIDYMMAGKPILCSYSGYRSMVNEANCGFFVESNEKIKLYETIIELSKKDRKLLDSIGKRGVEWLIKNRKWEKLANNYIDLF